MKAETKRWKTCKINMVFDKVKAMGATSQFYKFHAFVSNPCEICYFMGSISLKNKCHALFKHKRRVHNFCV